MRQNLTSFVFWHLKEQKLLSGSTVNISSVYKNITFACNYFSTYITAKEHHISGMLKFYLHIEVNNKITKPLLSWDGPIVSF